jgi:hypothetical protein
MVIRQIAGAHVIKEHRIEQTMSQMKRSRDLLGAQLTRAFPLPTSGSFDDLLQAIGSSEELGTNNRNEHFSHD